MTPDRHDVVTRLANVLAGDTEIKPPRVVYTKTGPVQENQPPWRRKTQEGNQ